MQLTPRLDAALKMLPGCGVLIDVGCDHAYLAIAAVESGTACRAVCSDVAEGPLASARENIDALDLSDRIELVMSDGFSNISRPDDDYSVTVCGMGGELIASIIEASDVPKHAKALILQPMSKEERLRTFLWENGYEITSERCAAEGERSYIVLSCVYTGNVTSFTDEETYLGKRDARVASREMRTRLEKFHAKHVNIRYLVSRSGADASQEDALVRAAEKEIIDIREKLK